MKTDSLKVAIESKLVIRTNELIAENIILKEQLRWRMESECPDKDGKYLCKQFGTGTKPSYSVVFFRKNHWVTGNPVVAWMPIPSESY